MEAKRTPKTGDFQVSIEDAMMKLKAKRDVLYLANDKLVESFHDDVKKGLEFCDARTPGKLHRWCKASWQASWCGAYSDVHGKINSKSCGGAEYFLEFINSKPTILY